MRNITVTLDEETARWARIEAARNEMSVSSFIRQLLRERIDGQESYEAAMTRFLSREPKPLRSDQSPYPTRDEIHDRAGFR